MNSRIFFILLLLVILPALMLTGGCALCSPDGTSAQDNYEPYQYQPLISPDAVQDFSHQERHWERDQDRWMQRQQQNQQQTFGIINGAIQQDNAWRQQHGK